MYAMILYDGVWFVTLSMDGWSAPYNCSIIAHPMSIA